MKLSKIDAKLHLQALSYLKQDSLSFEEITFVLTNYQESANNLITQSGAFFTPIEMAWELGLLAVGFSAQKKLRVLDLCAGIGVLAHSCLLRNKDIELVCVEINQEYVDIGKRLVPEAQWLCMDAMDLDALKALGHFDVVVSNPPFGAVVTGKDKRPPRYTGSNFAYKIIDIAAEIADSGYFILQQPDVNYRYSGRSDNLTNMVNKKYDDFVKQTGWVISGDWPSDTTLLGQFKNTAITVEFASVEYSEIRYESQQQGEAA